MLAWLEYSPYLRIDDFTLCLYLTDMVDYIVYGTVIQEVKTSNLAREVSSSCEFN